MSRALSSWVIGLLILSGSATIFAAGDPDRRLPAVRLGTDPILIDGESVTFEITAAADPDGDEERFYRAVLAEIGRDRKLNPNLSITVLAESDGPPALEPVNTEARATSGSAAPLQKELGIADTATRPATASLAARIASRFHDASLFYVNCIRPRLPVAPDVPAETRAHPLRMMKIKGLIGVATGLLILYLATDPEGATLPYVLSGLEFTALQSLVAMTTANRNEEIVTWFNDLGNYQAKGVEDKSRLGIRRNLKSFSLGLILQALAQFNAGMSGIKSTLWDPESTVAGAGFGTLIAWPWNTVITKHLGPNSPWKSGIPVIAYAIGNIATAAMVLRGPWNLVSAISWGSIAVSGLTTLLILNRKEVAEHARKLAHATGRACRLIGKLAPTATLPRLPLGLR